MTPEQKHMGIVAQLDCVVCREYLKERTPCCVHHVAKGTSMRSDFLTAGLCPFHHKGSGEGFHDSPKLFLMRWKLDNEFQLLGLVNKFRMQDGI